MIQSNPSIIRTFKRRELLPSSQINLWQIETGVVRTFSFTEDGVIIPLGFWGTGDIVGEPLIGIQPCQVECLVDVKARPLEWGQCEYLNQVMLSHIHQMQSLLQIRSGQVPQRLWHLLRWLAHRFGSQTKQGYLIELNLTHQDMADAAGTTRVTVTRLLRQFEQEGIIQRLGRNRLLWYYSDLYPLSS
jgi:CRP-like cAMP-binding protein